MKSANRELVDRLAAEYVLGTLRYRARRRFERWLLSPQVGALVKAWEDRLAGLEPQLTPVTPPATVWRGIENKLELRKLQRRPAMRWLGIAASLIFFVAVGVFITRPPAQPPMTAQSSLQTDPQTIYWRVEVLGDNQELNLHVQHGARPAGRQVARAVGIAGGWRSGVTGAAAAHGRSPPRAQRPRSARHWRTRSRSRSVSSPKGARRLVLRPRCCSRRHLRRPDPRGCFHRQAGVKSFSIR